MYVKSENYVVCFIFDAFFSIDSNKVSSQQLAHKGLLRSAKLEPKVGRRRIKVGAKAASSGGMLTTRRNRPENGARTLDSLIRSPAGILAFSPHKEVNEADETPGYEK